MCDCCWRCTLLPAPQHTLQEKPQPEGVGVGGSLTFSGDTGLPPVCSSVQQHSLLCTQCDRQNTARTAPHLLISACLSAFHTPVQIICVSMPRLATINLHNDGHVTDDGLPYLARLRHLTSLDLQGSISITNRCGQGVAGEYWFVSASVVTRGRWV